MSFRIYCRGLVAWSGCINNFEQALIKKYEEGFLTTFRRNDMFTLSILILQLAVSFTVFTYVANWYLTPHISTNSKNQKSTVSVKS